MENNETPQTHRIRHYVYAGDTLIPRESGMRGAWACEAKCSCGWETRSGGALLSFIKREVADHKFFAKYEDSNLEGFRR